MRNEDEFIRDALSGFWKNEYYWLARHIEIIRAYIVSRSLWDECIFISVGETDAWEYARYEIKPLMSDEYFPCHYHSKLG